MKLFVVWTCGLVCFAALAQQQSGKPEFEVASIKPSAPMRPGQMFIRMGADAGMLRYTNVALRDCIRVAYRVKDFQVQGPDWLGSARFDIVAKLPEGSSEDQVPEMLQTLLAERFKLTVHRETKEHAIYALIAGKDGPKLKPAEVAASDPPAAGGGEPRGGPPRGAVMMQVDSAGAHLKAPAVTLGQLAEMISRFSERPILDMTGIQGRYDFDLVFAPETTIGLREFGGRMPPQGGQRPPAEAPAEPAGSIYDSVQRYGLKLEPRKAPLEVVVVDHIEKEPTEN